MNVLLSTVRRTLVPAVLWPTLLVTLGATWVATELVSANLGPTEEFLAEIRHGCMLFGGLLVLSLAEPLQVAREARDGLLLLRAARGKGFGLPMRWAGLFLATLPAVLAAGVVARGLPAAPLALALELALLAAAGLTLGAFLERGRLVPVLWALAVAGQLRPWLSASAWGTPVAWLLPDFSGLDEGGVLAVAHAAAWIVGALLIARWRLGSVAARGRWPEGQASVEGPSAIVEAPGGSRVSG